MAEYVISQDTEKESEGSEGHSRTGDQGGGQVRTQNENEEVRHTHKLESAEGGSGQDPEGGVDLRHSLSGEGRERYKLGHGNKVSEQGAPTSWTEQGRDESVSRKQAGGVEVSEQKALTNWKWQREPTSQDRKSKRESTRRALTSWKAHKETSQDT